MKKTDYWCKFLTGTHWRKFRDNAEIIIERAEHMGYGKIECLCKQFNSSFDDYGHKVRNFTIASDSWFGESTDVETIVKRGFLLVPDAIGIGRDYLREDLYYKNMNNLGCGESLRHVDIMHELKGMTNGRRGEPVALFSHGIPVGRLISIKGLIIGCENGPDYMYENVM